MKNKILFHLTIYIIITTAIILFNMNQSISTLQFFPIDESKSFVSAKTSLLMSPAGKNNYEIDWSSQSATDSSYYLRQDVGILYENGILRGMQSKWKQNTKQINLRTTLKNDQEGFYEAITFHHAEIHQSDEVIKSIQTMTKDNLFVIKSNGNFTINNNINDLKSIESKTLQTLQKKWNELMREAQIDKNNYIQIPITHLEMFNDQALPNQTKEETTQIVGRLWEGLYKNYIVPLNESKISSDDVMPVILFSKSNDHLIVLYTFNGKPKQLIQKIP